MTEDTKQIIVLALIGGTLLSFLSLFNVTQPIASNFETVQHQGIDIICDKDKASAKIDCIGEYQRGWPVVAGGGFVVSARDGRDNFQFDLRPVGLLYNALVLSVPVGVAAYVVTRRADEDTGN